jgi:uncharacterized membrane protein YdfJ with MMPL/SSD domain
MSDPRSPLDTLWRLALTILGISIVLTIALWLLSKIWLVLLLIAVVIASLYAAFLWLRRRRGQW